MGLALLQSAGVDSLPQGGHIASVHFLRTMIGEGGSTLSGGEKQRISLIRLLLMDGEVFLLDEPTSALDYGNQLRVLQKVSSLSAQGYTILLSCHNPQHALLYAHRVIALADGTICADGAPESALTPALIRRLYGVDAHFIRTQDGVLIAPAQNS